MNSFGELGENSGNLQSKYGNKAMKHLTLKNWSSGYFFLSSPESVGQFPMLMALLLVNLKIKELTKPTTLEVLCICGEFLNFCPCRFFRLNL